MCAASPRSSVLGKRPEVARQTRRVEACTQRLCRSALKLRLGAAAEEELAESDELLEADAAVSGGVFAESTRVEVLAPLDLIGKDEDQVVSCADEVAVPLAQRRAEADDGPRRVAANKLPPLERLRNDAAAAGAHRANLRHGRAEHDVLPDDVPISVAVVQRTGRSQKCPRQQARH